MPGPHQVDARTPARSRLGGVAAFGSVGLGLSTLYASTGIGLPCPWRALTGTLCPFCGATTMGAALLRGDLTAAWQANAFVLALLVGTAVAGVGWLAQAFGAPRLRLPALVSRQRLWYLALAAAGLAFAVVRNLA